MSESMAKSCSNSSPGGSGSRLKSAKGTRRYSACPPWYGPICAYPYAAPSTPSVGLVRRQNEVHPATQLRQVPQAMLNGTETRSPGLIQLTPGPVSSTMPVFSWPSTLPCSTLVRPSYMCRSDPQMLVVVIRTIASPGASILGCGTSSTATLNGPLYTTAFMAPPGSARYQPASGRQTWIAPPTSRVRKTGCGAVAGPRATDPSPIRNTLPGQGQGRRPSDSSLSESGPDMWLHRSASTCTAPPARMATTGTSPSSCRTGLPSGRSDDGMRWCQPGL